MATNTSILGLSKPAYTDDADVAVINSNSDLIDAEAGRTRANFAAEYSASSAYAVGAFCTHNGILYQCNTAIGSGGEAWTSGHWTQISAGDAIVANNQAIANLKTITDITSSCVWGADVSVKYCKIFPAIKLMFLYAQIPSGKANTFGFCKLPSGYKFADNVIETVSASGSQRIQYGVSANADTAYMYTSDGSASAAAAQVNAILFYA